MRKHTQYVVATLVAAFLIMLVIGFSGATPVLAGELQRTLDEWSERLPPGKIRFQSTHDPNWALTVFGHSRYQFSQREGSALHGEWSEQALGANAELGERVRLNSLFIGNDPYGGGEPMLRWLFLQTRVYGPVHLRLGQQPIPFGLDQTIYGPADVNLPVTRRPIDLATAADKAVSLDAELIVLGKPAHGWFFISQGRGPNLNDDNEPLRDYGGRLQLQAHPKLDLGASLQIGKRRQHEPRPPGSRLGDQDTYQQSLGTDFRFYPQGRSGRLRLEGEWISQHRDIPWGEDLVLRQGYLRGIWTWRQGLEVVPQLRYDVPDGTNPRLSAGEKLVAFLLGLNIGLPDSRQRLQLGYEFQEGEPDEFKFVWQIRF